VPLETGDVLATSRSICRINRSITAVVAAQNLVAGSQFPVAGYRAASGRRKAAGTGPAR
jgi:hypothetical protein